MAATFNVMFDFGGTDGSPGTSQNIDSYSPNLRFKTADNATIDANHPIPIPTSGTNYSYWKQIYLKCTGAPTTQVDNIRFYSDGSSGFGTGVALKVGDETPVKNSGASTGYEVATGTAGSTGDEMVAAHAGLTGSASVFSYTSASPLTVSISESGNIINATNETTNYIILQMEVADTASPGSLSAETLTFMYDEV